jgi:hypothetical protein
MTPAIKQPRAGFRLTELPAMYGSLARRCSPLRYRYSSGSGSQANLTSESALAGVIWRPPAVQAPVPSNASRVTIAW